MIEVTQLSKSFGSTLAVDNLTRPTSGTATVLGRDFRTIRNVGSHVGVLLDAGAMHPGRTGAETLKLAAFTIGVPLKRVAELLAYVGLDNSAARKRVGQYSLGMRQRLGIALALLASPEVLILDEPANGLDPAGILWMRSVLREFADDGGTVLLSSHLLHEVEQVADYLVLIDKGQIQAQGSKSELLAGGDLESLFMDITQGATK